MTDTVDKVIIQSEVQGASQATGDLNKVAGALDGVTVAADKVEKSTSSIEGRFASLERRLGTTAGQQAQYEKIQSQVNLAVAQNPALQERANEVLAAAEARYLAAGSGVKELAEAHKGLDAQGQAALHSIRSVAEQLALGISPTQALTGQINHLTFAASGEGGLAGAFGQVRTIASGAISTLAGLITPVNVAIAGVAGLTAAAAALALAWDKVQVSSERAISGAGARTGTTVSDLNKFTADNSGGFGSTGLSNKEVRSLGEEFTKTGEIVVSRLHGMSDAVLGFANQSGKSIEEAKKALVGFAVDPKKGLDELAKTYGSFDVATQKAVDALVLAGDKTGAFQVIMDSLSQKSKEAASNLGVFESAARRATNVLGGESTKPSGLESEVGAAAGRLNAAIDGAPAGGDARAGAASADIARLSREYETLYAAQQKVIDQNMAAQFDDLATKAGAVDQAIIPQINQLEQLRQKLEELKQAQGAGASSKYGPEVDSASITSIQNQIEQLHEAQAEAQRYQERVAEISEKWGGVSQSTALALEAAQNQLPVLGAVGESAKMAAQYAADYANAMDKGKSSTDAAALAASNLAAAEASAASAAQEKADRQAASQAETEARQRERQAAAAAAADARQHEADLEWQADMLGVSAKAQAAAAASAQMADQMERAARAASALFHEFDPVIMKKGNLSFSSDPGIRPDGHGGFTIQPGMSGGPNQIQPAGYQEALQAIYNTPVGASVLADDAVKAGGVDGAISAITNFIKTHEAPVTDATGTLQSLYSLKNSTAPDNGTKISNDQQFLSWLQSQPQTVANLQAISTLTNEIKSLSQSTNNLNATNQELLSPYYSQDPRTSHIGFRSQGMADGGWIDVPGSPSANDNMVAMVPVAGGERILVDPNRAVRGGGGGTTISISMPITIQGNASKDEVGRTMYQAGQSLARQLAAVSR